MSGFCSFRLVISAAVLLAIIGIVNGAVLLSVLSPVRMLSKITTSRVSASRCSSCTDNRAGHTQQQPGGDGLQLHSKVSDELHIRHNKCAVLQVRHVLQDCTHWNGPYVHAEAPS